MGQRTNTGDRPSTQDEAKTSKERSPARRSKRTYTEQEKDLALFALALSSGNSRQASKMLRDSDGPNVPAKTMDSWKARDPDRYRRVVEEVAPKVAADTAERMQALVVIYDDLERKTALRYEEELPNLRPGELPGALRNVAVTKGINIDKAQLLRGEPTQRLESVEAHSTALAALKRLAPGLVIEGTATEVVGPDRQLGPEEPTPEVGRRVGSGSV